MPGAGYRADSRKRIGSIRREKGPNHPESNGLILS
jgi:hypothetical protein